MARESFEDRYPESRGPGVETVGDGGVRYGDTAGPTVVIPPRRPAAERDADMARARDGCSRCAELPADLIQALTAALRAAKAGGRP
jgi:hypothetical protein